MDYEVKADALEDSFAAIEAAGVPPVIERPMISGAAPDHPFLGHVPEGRYLKAIFARVL